MAEHDTLSPAITCTLVRWQGALPAEVCAAWDALAAADGSGPVFNNRTWFELAYRRKAIAPRGVLLVWDHGQPAGLFPLEQRTPWSWGGIFALGMDDLQAVIHPSREDAAWAGVARWVRERPGAALLTLGVCSRAARVPRFTEVCRREGVIPLVIPDPSPVVRCPVPSCWDGFLASLGKLSRRNIRHAENILTRDYPDLSIEFLTDPAACLPVLDDLIRLFRLRWGNRGGGCDFDSPRHAAFYRDAVEWAVRQGHGMVAVLRAEGRTQGAITLFRSAARDILTAHFVGRDLTSIPRRHSAGLVLFSHVLRHAIDEGYATLNFGQGIRAYKLLLGGQPFPRWKLMIARSQAGVAVLPRIDRLVHMAKRAPVYAGNSVKGVLHRTARDGMVEDGD